MKPSERLALIKRIAPVLSQEEWVSIDLTLRTFGLPTSDEGYGGTLSYVLHMLTDAPGDSIRELAEHLGLEPSPSNPLPEPAGCWKEGFFRLFITHLASEKDYATSLKDQLRAYGVSGFVAHEDIEPTLEWQDAIEAALMSADALVALMHPGFHESRWTDQEIGVAIGRGIPVLSVRLGVDPYGFIGKFQAIRGIDRIPWAVAQDIFTYLARNERVAAKVSSAAVYRVEHSFGHKDAQAIFTAVLPQLTYLDDALADRLLNSLDGAGYVARAYNKVKVMRALFTRLGREFTYTEPKPPAEIERY